MSQAIADPFTAQEPSQADNAGTENANLDLRDLGIPMELMTDLPVDTPSRQALEAQQMLAADQGSAPPPQQPAPQQSPPPQSQQPPSPQQQSAPLAQPPHQPAPQQGLPINQQPPAPPQPHGADNLANNYRFSAKGDPVKQMAFTLLKENPALTLVEADTKARERLGLAPTAEEQTLEQQIAAMQQEADQAAEDMDLSKSRKLDREVAEKKAALEQQRRQRESAARQQMEFEEAEVAAQDRVAQQYPDAFVEGSLMSQTMRAINQAMIGANDPRLNDASVIAAIAEQAASQLRQQGYQPGWTHYSVPVAQPQPMPQQPPVPPQPVYPAQIPAVQAPPQHYYAPQPWYPGPAPVPQSYPPQLPPVPSQQQPYQPPIASGAEGRQQQGNSREKAFLERLEKVQKSAGLEEYEQLAEDIANGRI